MSDDKRVAVLGAGMHPWASGSQLRRVRRPRRPRGPRRCGLELARRAVRLGCRHHPQRLPRLHRRCHLRPGPRLDRCQGGELVRGVRIGRVGHRQRPAQILAGLCDVALVVGADTTPKGFFAPVGGERRDDPDWLRFHLLGATNPTYFALYARRRMDRFGATDEDFAQVKVKNSRHGAANPNARYRDVVTAEQVLASPMVADPLRLLEICATSDGGAALVLSSMEFARRHAGAEPAVTIAAVSTVTPRFPNRVIEMPNFSTDSAAAVTGDIEGFRPSIVRAVYEEAGIGPDDVDLAEVYDLSAALELDWYEDIGLCGEGEAEKLLADGVTSLGGRVPVNPSGGLSSFARPSRPRRSHRCARRCGSCAARPPAARSRAPGWRSPPTRASSATARRCSSRVRCPVHGPCGGGPSSTKWSRRRSPRHDRPRRAHVL